MASLNHHDQILRGRYYYPHFMAGDTEPREIKKLFFYVTQLLSGYPGLWGSVSVSGLQHVVLEDILSMNGL